MSELFYANMGYKPLRDKAAQAAKIKAELEPASSVFISWLVPVTEIRGCCQMDPILSLKNLLK